MYNHAKWYALYSVGYIDSLCFGIVVTRPWAGHMLSTLERVWGVLTFCQAAVKNPRHLFALRFFIGLAEGLIFASAVYILGSWYGRDEIYRRIMAFSVSSTVGGRFSCYLQTAAYSTLNGDAGPAGWQLGLIIDGIVTVPEALMDSPCSPKPLIRSRKCGSSRRAQLGQAKTGQVRYLHSYQDHVWNSQKNFHLMARPSVHGPLGTAKCGCPSWRIRSSTMTGFKAWVLVCCTEKQLSYYPVGCQHRCSVPVGRTVWHISYLLFPDHCSVALYLVIQQSSCLEYSKWIQMVPLHDYMVWYR